MGRKNKNKSKPKPKQEVSKEVKEVILVAGESSKKASKKVEELPKCWNKLFSKPTSSDSLKFCHKDAYENDFPQLGAAKTKKKQQKCDESKNKCEYSANVAEGEQNGILVTETNISSEQQLDNYIEEELPKQFQTMVWYVKNPKTKKYQVEQSESQEALSQPKQVHQKSSSVAKPISKVGKSCMLNHALIK